MASLDEVFGGDENEVAACAGKRRLVLGAGGVARAIVVGLRRRKADITIASRTPERADDLAQFCERQVAGLGAAAHRQAATWSSTARPSACTPTSTKRRSTPKYLRKEMVVFDTVYNPEQTLLLKQAREAGCTVITGVDMFIGQAALQFKLFTGQEANHRADAAGHPPHDQRGEVLIPKAATSGRASLFGATD